MGYVCNDGQSGIVTVDVTSTGRSSMTLIHPGVVVAQAVDYKFTLPTHTKFISVCVRGGRKRERGGERV